MDTQPTDTQPTDTQPTDAQPTDAETVRAYYASYGQREWQRLERAEGVVEWIVTTAILDAHLPATGHVLDLGGGPGRYSSWLLERGNDVTLADLSPELLDIARARPDRDRMAEITEADARDLSRWPDAAFDHVLALGPMYHLTDPVERAQAGAEMVRVLRPGGMIAIATMPWYGSLRRTLALPDERRHFADAQFVDDLKSHGIFHNDVPGRFNSGYGFRPAEIAPYFEELGLTTVTLVSTHGYASGMEETIVALRDEHPTAYEVAMRLLIDTADDPSLFGLAGHLLYVGTKDM